MVLEIIHYDFVSDPRLLYHYHFFFICYIWTVIGFAVLIATVDSDSWSDWPGANVFKDMGSTSSILWGMA